MYCKRGELVTRPAVTMRGPLTAEDAPEHNGSTSLAIMTVAGLMTEIVKAAGEGGESEMYEARKNVKKMFLWKDVWRREEKS